MPNDLWCQKDPKFEFTYHDHNGKQQVVQVHVVTGVLEQPVPHKTDHQPMLFDLVYPADWDIKTVKEPAGTKIPLQMRFRPEPNGVRLLFKLHPNDEIKRADSELRMEVTIPQLKLTVDSVYEPTENIRLVEIQVGESVVKPLSSTWT